MRLYIYILYNLQGSSAHPSTNLAIFSCARFHVESVYITLPEAVVLKLPPFPKVPSNLKRLAVQKYVLLFIIVVGIFLYMSLS